MIVRTETRLPSGEPVASQLHRVTIGPNAQISPGLRLPGGGAAGALVRSSNDEGVLAASRILPNLRDGQEDSERSYAIVIAPDQEYSDVTWMSPFGEELLGAWISSTENGRVLVALCRPSGMSRSFVGFLHLQPLGPGQPTLSPPGGTTLELPGHPVAACWNAALGGAAILCATEQAGAMVLLVHPDRPSSPRTIALPQEPTGAGSLMPSGISISGDGTRLAVLVSGRSLDRPSGGDISWLYVYDTQSAESVAPPCMLPGMASPSEDPLAFDTRGAIWVNTREPSAGFGHVARVEATGDRLRLTRTDAYVGVVERMWTAPSPDGARLATGVGHRISIMPGETAIEFAAPLTWVDWESHGLYVGEGGRLHRVDPETGEIVASVQFQTGAVVDAMATQGPREADPAPHAPDGPEPQATFGSTIPEALTFHADAAGNEVQSLMLPPGPAPGTPWAIDFDEVSMPWLHVYPREGTLPSRILLGVSPDYRAGTGQISFGALEIRVPPVPGHGIGVPLGLEIRVTPDHHAVRRILWIDDVKRSPYSLRSPMSPRRLGALTNLLAASPLSFSHVESYGAVDLPLDSCTLVVITSTAAAAGVVTRSALLDYVAAGGALLFLGEFVGDSPDTYWLAPAGIRLSPATRLEGTYAPTSDHELARNWESFSIVSGMAFRADSPDTVVVPGPHGTDYAVLAASTHGLGRIACLASATPLQDRALSGESARRFAADLFTWLSRARYEIADHDGDGLSDNTEDRNGNGGVDPGETDHLNRDSDGDAIPDSLEDLNRNGWMDEGELNPANPDSDSDGVQDGADPDPLPKAGTPYLGGIETSDGGPAEGPSEGGTIVEISGRNFTDKTRIWFGETLSPQVRTVDAGHLTAVTPPYDSPTGGTVKVRAVDVAGQQEDSLKSGFRYTPRSIAKILLSSISAGINDTGQYEGVLQVSVECPGVSLGIVGIRLAAVGVEEIEWVSARPSEHASTLQRNVSGKPMPPNEFSVRISPGNLHRDLGDAARIQWRIPQVPENGLLHFQVKDAQVRARNGVALPVKTVPATISLTDAALGSGR